MSASRISVALRRRIPLHPHVMWQQEPEVSQFEGKALLRELNLEPSARDCQASEAKPDPHTDRQRLGKQKNDG